METLHNGRTLDVRVFINTDEETSVVLKRIREAAKGPKKECLVVTQISECKKEESDKLWNRVFIELEKNNLTEEDLP